MIEKYLTQIRKEKRYNEDFTEEIDCFLFEGDGSGDFEEISDSCDKNIVPDYIEYCKDQIRLAEEYLNRINEI